MTAPLLKCGGKIVRQFISSIIAMRISSPKMWQNFIFLILQLFLPCVLCIEITLEPTPPFAETKSGWVEGYIQKTVGGHQIVAFEGIKYAEAPTGQLRFRVRK